MERIYKGYAVVSVNGRNNIETSHAEISGWYQEVYETLEEAEDREQELLDTVGGIFEVVEAVLTFKRI